MTREEAYAYLEDPENVTVNRLIRKFGGCCAGTVMEAIVIWGHLPDCPAKYADDIRTLAKHIDYLPEFSSK